MVLRWRKPGSHCIRSNYAISMPKVGFVLATLVVMLLFMIGFHGLDAQHRSLRSQPSFCLIFSLCSSLSRCHGGHFHFDLMKMEKASSIHKDNTETVDQAGSRYGSRLRWRP